MKHLKKFNSYDPTWLYLTDQLSELVYFSYLDSVNESLLGDIITGVKSKIIEFYWKALEVGLKIGFKILEKVKSITGWIIGKIKSFKEKNPVLWKVLVITILVLLLLIISCGVAHAAVTGQPVDEKYINIAIGLLEDMNVHGKIESYTDLDVSKSIAYLIELKGRGQVLQTDSTQFGQMAVDLANLAIKTAKKIDEDSKTDTTVLNWCIDLLQRGEKFVSYEIIKNSAGETVKLYTK
jgi:hypothetical protein